AGRTWHLLPSVSTAIQGSGNSRRQQFAGHRRSGWLVTTAALVWLSAAGSLLSSTTNLHVKSSPCRGDSTARGGCRPVVVASLHTPSNYNVICANSYLRWGGLRRNVWGIAD